MKMKFSITRTYNYHKLTNVDIFCLGRIEATGTFNHFVMVFTPSFDPCHVNFWKIKMVDMFDIIKSGPESLDNQ